VDIPTGPGPRLDFIMHPSFEDSSLEAEIVAEMPRAREYEASRLTMKAPASLPPALASLFEWPLLERDQERHLFRKMNYLKYRAAKLRDRLTEAGQGREDFERLCAEANAVKELLINANMRLVVSAVKRYTTGAAHFFELLAEGKRILTRAVETFDFDRGHKFMTYATWAIMTRIAPSTSAETPQPGGSE
jgi:DNA-directed RNA polymerase sigma subunit (sigma70/sigma32)